jgi:hypothetical protein
LTLFFRFLPVFPVSSGFPGFFRFSVVNAVTIVSREPDLSRVLNPGHVPDACHVLAAAPGDDISAGIVKIEG